MVLLLGAFLQRLIYTLPNFHIYLRQKHFFDNIYSAGGKIMNNGINSIIDTKNCEEICTYKIIIRKNTSDHLVFTQVLINNEYKSLIDIVSNNQKAESVKYIIDAGSNIGLTSLYFTSYYDEAKIIALEPDEHNFKVLQDNIKLNDLKNIVTINAALWNNNNDELTIDKSFRDGREWSRAVIPGNVNDSNIQLLTIMDIINKYSWPYIDIMKMDIEGAEKFIFQDPEQVRQFLSKIKFLAIEIHDELNIKKHILSQLAANNFELNEVGETVVGFNKSHVISPMA
ncbi:MAG: hypothetical protein COB85_09150 [Bacteroidetes bacterium]|nr:MAG: hypothetical protein COB85_09150 [Bacteroidota bacterium]